MVALMHGRRAGKKMTDEFLVGEVATLFMAGFETTGVPSLSFCSVGLLRSTRKPAHIKLAALGGCTTSLDVC